MKGNTARKLITAMLFAVLVYGGFAIYRGIGTIWNALASFTWSTFVIACALAFVNYILRFLKWEYYLAVLDIRGIPKGESFLTFLSGFVLTVTPGKVGEVFKSVILHETRGVPLPKSAPIVVAERVTDLIGVIALIALGSLGFQGGLAWAIAGSIVVAMILILISSKTISSLFFSFLRSFGRITQRFLPKIEEAFEQLRCLTTPSRLILPTLLSIAAWSLEGFGLYVILGGFHQTPQLALAGFVYSTATLAGALVPVPGGLGVTEGLIEQQLVHLGGVAHDAATASMLLIRFATLWFGVAVGFTALGLLRRRYPTLFHSQS